MSQNLYEINEDLRQIFLEIEEAEGEITEEVGDRLAIAEDEYEKKIMSYYSAIKARQSNNLMIDDEVKRLKRKAASNARIEARLKESVLNAVLEFGVPGKSGNKTLDLDTLKLWTVNKDKVVFEDADSFEDPRFCHVPVNVPSNFNIVQKVYEYAVSICKDKEYVQEINMNIKKTITGKKISAFLSQGNSVKGAKLVSNPHIVMR